MNRRTFLKAVPAAGLLATHLSLAQQADSASKPAQELQELKLPRPEKEGGKSVMAALWERKTIRDLSDKPLEPQVLSNLLWAAWGVNRPDGPRGRIGRTAASASNSQEIDLYVILPEGVYLYEALAHRLVLVFGGDQREKLGRRGRGGGAAKAPVNLIFVVDLAKYARGNPQEPGLKDPEIQKSYSNVLTGLIAGNVYLFAASAGLGAWFHNCNKADLATTLKLRPAQRVLYAQTVGYPAITL